MTREITLEQESKVPTIRQIKEWGPGVAGVIIVLDRPDENGDLPLALEWYGDHSEDKGFLPHWLYFARRWCDGDVNEYQDAAYVVATISDIEKMTVEEVSTFGLDDDLRERITDLIRSSPYTLVAPLLVGGEEAEAQGKVVVEGEEEPAYDLTLYAEYASSRYAGEFGSSESEDDEVVKPRRKAKGRKVPQATSVDDEPVKPRRRKRAKVVKVDESDTEDVSEESPEEVPVTS